MRAELYPLLATCQIGALQPLTGTRQSCRLHGPTLYPPKAVEPKFFNIFALNIFLQYKKVGRWAGHLFGARIHIVLSLAAKAVLAWLIFAGTLAPV